MGALQFGCVEWCECFEGLIVARQQPDGLDKLLPLPEDQRQQRACEQQGRETAAVARGGEVNHQQSRPVDPPEQRQHQGDADNQNCLQAERLPESADPALINGSLRRGDAHQEQGGPVGVTPPQQHAGCDDGQAPDQQTLESWCWSEARAGQHEPQQLELQRNDG